MVKVEQKRIIKKVGAQTYIWVLLLLMYLPVLTLIIYSFTPSVNLGTWSGFSFDLYVALFNDKEIMTAVGNTIILALTSSLCSVILGTLGAIGAYNLKSKGRRSLEMVTQIPIVNPEIVMALSLTIMFVFIGNYIFKGFTMSFWTLLIGHIVLSLPFVYLSVKPKLLQMDPALYEAALDLGAKPKTALRKVVFPAIFPGVMSGFLLAITLSLDDFIVTTFTRGAGLLNGNAMIETISTLVQAKIKKGPIPPEMRALTTIIFLFVIIIVITVTILMTRKNKMTKKNQLYRRKA